MANRVIQVEAGAVTVRVEGPDSLRSMESLTRRLLASLTDSAGRLPMGFQSGSGIVTERSQEEVE